MTNQIRFDSSEYHADSVKKESIMSWYPISPETSKLETLKVSKVEVDLQDLVIDLEDLTGF